MDTELGPPLHEERGYRVREVFDTAHAGASIGYTFEGPGFNALIIYPDPQEAVSALRSMIEACGPAGPHAPAYPAAGGSAAV